jgi:GTP cyclohydrolase I
MEDLPDVQSRQDTRQIGIDRVGVRGIDYPIRLLDRAKGVQCTVGRFALTVDLPHHFKGTHMSRFLEVLNESGGEVNVDSIGALLAELKRRLHAESAQMEVRFPYFMDREAPATGAKGTMAYPCGFRATSGVVDELEILVDCPITTLCPCSKEISSRGAHNQRGTVRAALLVDGMVWLEEVVEWIESAASCPLYPVLKRPDEKHVTEQAYDNPRFVEDVVREVALLFDKDPRVLRYEVEVENQESIHAHNAYACIRRHKR